MITPMQMRKNIRIELARLGEGAEFKITDIKEGMLKRGIDVDARQISASIRHKRECFRIKDRDCHKRYTYVILKVPSDTGR